jgi:hypothetical protein
MSTVILNWNRIMQSVRLYPRDAIKKGFWQVFQFDATLQNLLADSVNKDDIMKVLFDVFRESINQTNADKNYFLNRLAEQNEISEALMNYLEELLSKTDDSSLGPYKCRSKDEPDSWLPVRLTIKPAKKKYP